MASPFRRVWWSRDETRRVRREVPRPCLACASVTGGRKAGAFFGGFAWLMVCDFVSPLKFLAHV